MQELWILIFLLGLIMMTAEIFIFTFGMLAATGAVLFYMGVHMIGRESALFGMPVSPELVTTLSWCGVLILCGVMYYAVQAYSHRAKPLLEGEPVVVIEWAGTKGRVRLAGGEIWEATSQKLFTPGEGGRIVKIDNLLLTIE